MNGWTIVEDGAGNLWATIDIENPDWCKVPAWSKRFFYRSREKVRFVTDDPWIYMTENTQATRCYMRTCVFIVWLACYAALTKR